MVVGDFRNALKTSTTRSRSLALLLRQLTVVDRFRFRRRSLAVIAGLVLALGALATPAAPASDQSGLTPDRVLASLNGALAWYQQARVAMQSMEGGAGQTAVAIVQRAFYIDATRGLFKLVFERSSRRVVGIHVVSRSAGDVVQGYTLALKHGVTVDEIAAAHNAFPTFGEGLKYAAQRALPVAAFAR